MKFFTWIFVLLLTVASFEAEARRMGGGGSMGRQSGNVTQRDAAKPPPSQPGPAQNQATPAQPGTGAAAAAAPRRPLGGMLGGLAAGLGLAWLAHTLGFGEAFAQILLVALVVMVAMVVIGLIMRARNGGQSQRYAMQGAGAPADLARTPRQYSPDKVGNDSSARPWERSTMAFDARGGSGVQIGSALSGSQAWGIPAGFDAQGFVSAAKRNFVSLQDAWDRGDVPALRAMMTDEMLDEIRAQLAEREAHADSKPNQTDVVMLDAQLLGIEDLGDAYMASVEFSGMIREEPSAGPSPFREVWNMIKSKSGGGWLVAGVQAMQ
jgi:predicted lipid-binding transport protein (Tim44 family)